jgi:hypothetical protein
MTPVSNGVKRKRPPATWSPGATCIIGAPSARISLVRLRPRRAGFRFSGHLQSTTYWHDLRQEAPLKSGVRKIPRPNNRRQALDATGSFRDEAVLNYGVKITGCTVHFADNEYDHGPVILQKAVPVLDDDTPDSLAARVFAAECEAYPEALRLIAAGRVKLEGRRVRISPP